MPVTPRLLITACCASFLMACPRPALHFGPDGEAKSPAELLKRVALAEASVQGVKGDGRLGLESPEGKGSVTLFTAVQAPSSLHLEQLDFFGRPQGVLTTDGRDFGLFDATEGKFYRGPATGPNLARFLPIVMPPAELAALLLGQVPRLPEEGATMRVDPEARVYVVTLRRGGVTQVLHIDPPSSRVVKSTVTGAAAYDLEAGDVITVGGVTFPKHLVLTVPTRKVRLELEWKEFTLNEAPDANLFDFSAPENVPVIEVDAAGQPRSTVGAPP